MLRLFPKWACGLKLKKERGKNPDVKPQQCYLQYSLLTTEWTSRAFLIISAQWLSANCSSKPCRVLLICYLTLNTFHWIKSLQRDANSKSLKSGVIRFSPYYIKIISYSKSSIHSRREEWTHSVVTGTLLCSTKDWPCNHCYFRLAITTSTPKRLEHYHCCPTQNPNHLSYITGLENQISPVSDKSPTLSSIIKDSYLKPQVHLEFQPEYIISVFAVEINYCTLSV